MDPILITQLAFTIYISIILTIHEVYIIKTIFCKNENKNSDDVFNVQPHLSHIPEMPVFNLPETIKSDRNINV